LVTEAQSVSEATVVALALPAVTGEATIVFSQEPVVVGPATDRNEARQDEDETAAAAGFRVHAGRQGDFQFADLSQSFDPAMPASRSVWSNSQAGERTAGVFSEADDTDPTRGSRHYVSASSGSGDTVDDAVTALTSTFLIYPMACDQMLPNRQIECADAYMRTHQGPVPDHDRKRRESSWERA
jgi:hypothetical protein